MKHNIVKKTRKKYKFSFNLLLLKRIKCQKNIYEDQCGRTCSGSNIPVDCSWCRVQFACDLFTKYLVIIAKPRAQII